MEKEKVLEIEYQNVFDKVAVRIKKLIQELKQEIAIFKWVLGEIKKI